MVQLLLHLPALATTGAAAVRALSYKEASLPGTEALTGFVGTILEVCLVLILVGIALSAVVQVARMARGRDES